METKEYIVALHEGVDYDQFWLDIESPTSGLPHIPDRAVVITNNRTAFNRLCEYALTDSEADRVKNDSRVASVEIPVRNNPMVTVARSTTQTGNFNKTTYPWGLEINWGLIRHSQTTNVYGTGTTTTENLNRELEMLQINFMINNIELHKLLYSDPYQYKDELKRIKSFLSPRQSIISNSASMNAALNNIWNEGFDEGDIGRTDFTQDYFRTATYADVLAVGDIPGYEEEAFEETDGSVLLL